LQHKCDLVAAEEIFRSAFWQDVRPLLAEWRTARNLPIDPLCALRHGGYVERITQERSGKQSAGNSYA
jgi:L-rhamnose isomerase/sugar isomerase